MHSDREKYALELEEKLKECTSFKKIFVSDVFSGCGTNIGPGMICANFIGDKVSEDGTIEKCSDNMCPEEWFRHLISKGIMPLMAPSLKEYPLYDKAFSYGSRIVNTDDPEGMMKHLKKQRLHD